MMKRINSEMKIAREIKTELEIEPVSKSSVSNETVVEVIPEENPVVKLEPEIQEDFHAVMDTIKCEDTKLAGQFETVFIKPAVLSGNYEVPRSEQSLEFSQVLLELNDDISSLCRLCARRANGMVHMFDPNQLYKNIIEKIEQCLPIVVREDDTLPKEACRVCLEKLELCYQFHNSVAEAEKQLLMFSEPISKKIRRAEKRGKTSSLYKRKRDPAKRHVNNDGQSKTSYKSIAIAKEVEIIDSTVENNIISSNSRGLFSTETHCSRDLNESRSTRSSSDEQDCALEIRLNSSRMSLSEIEENICYSPPNSPRRPGFVEDLNCDKNTFDFEISSSPITGDDRGNDSPRKESGKESDDDDVIFSKEEFEDQTVSGPNIESELLKCKICGKDLQYPEGIHAHEVVHALAHYYPCCICGEIFVTEKELRKHSLDHIQDNKLIVTAVTKDCNEPENFVAQLKQKFHKLYHNSGAKPQCISEEQFKTQEAPDAQKKQGPAVICPLCKNRFHADVLEMHVETCRPEPMLKKKVFICAYCEKEFTRKDFLEDHVLRHTGQLPYKCKLCRQKFRNKRARNNHLKLHNGKRLFECSICDKTFTKIKGLLGHVQIHSDKMRYKCPVCNEKFNTSKLRDCHVAIHSIIKSRQCDMCGMYFTRKGDLIRHIGILHGEIDAEN